MNDETTKTSEYEFNIDKMPLTKSLVDLYQEGNFLVGTTEHGIRFRQHIPADKLLTREEGEYRLIDRVVT